MKKFVPLRKNPRISRKNLFAFAEPLESRRLLAANVVISEFMASNSHTLQDAAGDYPDWIELHNAGDAAANLNNYYLTDSAGNPELWRFPAGQSLAAGSYLVVFADGTTAAPVANTELHANFSIGASGEYLGLINAADDSVAFDYSPQFPAQTADISYGLYDANVPTSAKLFFTTPTPGAANAPAAYETTYSVSGKTFTGTLQVGLSSTTPGAQIRYTINGTVPTASSTLYTAPLSLTNTTMLRTIVFASGYASSPVTSQSYIALNSTTSTTSTLGSSTLSTFTSNLPIVMINTFGTTISDTVDNAASISFIDTTNGTASILGTPNYIGRTGFRIRGSTSEGYPKQQYSLELWDETNDDKKAALLGMPADSDWVLYAPYTEKTMMQNALAYQWANETGNYAPGTRFVEVFMNTSAVTPGGVASPSTGANYIGVYILEEKIKIDSSRVDVDEISPTNPNGGFIISKDRNDSGTESSFTTSIYSQTFINTEPDKSSITTAESTTIKNVMSAFETAFSSTGWNLPTSPNYYGNYLNVGSFVDYYLINEMTRNVDSFWLSTFFSKAADTTVNGVTTRGLISAGPVWDFNLGLGAANYNSSANSDGWDLSTLTTTQAGYFARLLTDPNFVQKVADRWEQLRSTVFSTSNLLANIDADVSLLANGTTNYPVGSAPTQAATNPVVRNFKKWPELGVYVVTEGLYDPAGSWIQEVNLMKNWLTARVNWIDSQFAPEPTITPGGDYGGTTTVTMGPLSKATTTDTQLVGPNSTFYYKLPTAAISGWQTLSATSQPSGWNTLTNGSGSVTTGLGYDTTPTNSGNVDFTPYISTNIQSTMFQQNADVYMLTNFVLSDPNSIQALILKIRYDDGFVAWVNGVRVMDANSPENINPTYTTAAAGSGDDTQAILYREFDITSVKNLLKVGNNTLAIQGLNSGTGSEDFLLAPTLYTRTYSNPATGTVYYTTDGSDPRTTTGSISSTAHAYSSALSLSSDTEIKARTLSGGIWGGLTDQIYNFDSTSLRITELMFNPPPLAPFATQDLEFVELQNTSSSPLNLTGYAFTNGVTFTFPNVTLAAGAYGVVVKNPTAFATRYGSSPNVLGTYTGSFDNSGEKVELSNGFAQVIESFKYLPSYGNGDGHSMVVLDPTGDPAALSAATGWRASFALDGQPGYADTNATAPSLTSWSASDATSPTLTFTFNTPISSGSVANITITNAVTGSPVTPASYLIDGSTVTFTFASTLASGAYLFSLPAGDFVNASNTGTASSSAGSFALVRASQTWAIPSTGPGLIVQKLVLGTGAKLDIGTGSLLIDYTGATPADSIRQSLATGFASGAWNGVGIISSAASSNPNHSVAGVEASSIGLSTFASQPVDSTAILLKYVATGDANLDGFVDDDDYALLDRGLAKHLTGWTAGDFNYDNSVTSADTALLDKSFSGVSEPSTPVQAPAVVSLPQTVTLSSTPVEDTSDEPVTPAAPSSPTPVAAPVEDTSNEPIVVAAALPSNPFLATPLAKVATKKVAAPVVKKPAQAAKPVKVPPKKVVHPAVKVLPKKVVHAPVKAKPIKVVKVVHPAPKPVVKPKAKAVVHKSVFSVVKIKSISKK